jgi:hypothetical protein
MAILTVTSIAFVLVLATIAIHYESLRQLSDAVPRLTVPMRARVLVVIAGVFLAHLVEIALFAGAFALLHRLEFGAVGGNFEYSALDYFYLSMSSYTTLGIGDVFPTGPMRILSAIEALNGFVLVGWSASFTYLEMEHFWKKQRRKVRSLRR